MPRADRVLIAGGPVDRPLGCLRQRVAVDEHVARIIRIDRVEYGAGRTAELDR